MPQTTVLVIEDEPLIRMAVADDLREAGFNALEAANAYDALRILSTEASIDAIFTDIDLHGELDGLSLAWIVNERWPPIRIIITSGKRWLERDRMPDGSVFFPKPYAHQTIINALTRLMS
ncbi:response regulator [Neorhizobium alkalisoli]|uniref:response regulator n=1 Tax=Neorhizobium alkalisoli TaxID=528178 RepID=UPI000CF919E2|nr:response regulator [Neorhizobium alkalisoli]